MSEGWSIFRSKPVCEGHCQYEIHTRTRTVVAPLVLLLAILAVGFAGQAQQSASEAPAGFETPTLSDDPGSKSTSNGLVEPPGDTFALDQQVYERIHDANSGLGPVFNGRACAECHQNPVSGGASQFTELRVGHIDANGNFVNPTVLIDDGANSITGRSIINDRALDSRGAGTHSHHRAYPYVTRRSQHSGRRIRRVHRRQHLASHSPASS